MLFHFPLHLKLYDIQNALFILKCRPIFNQTLWWNNGPCVATKTTTVAAGCIFHQQRQWSVAESRAGRRPRVTVVFFFFSVLSFCLHFSLDWPFRQTILDRVLINVLYMSAFSVLVFFSWEKAGKDQSGHSCEFRQKGTTAARLPACDSAATTSVFLFFRFWKEACRINPPAFRRPLRALRHSSYTVQTAHVRIGGLRALLVSPHHEYR